MSNDWEAIWEPSNLADSNLIPKELESYMDNFITIADTLSSIASTTKSVLNATKYFLSDDFNPALIFLVFALDEMINVLVRLRKTNVYIGAIYPTMTIESTDTKSIKPDFVSFKEFGLFFNTFELNELRLKLNEENTKLVAANVEVQAANKKIIDALKESNKPDSEEKFDAAMAEKAAAKNISIVILKKIKKFKSDIKTIEIESAKLGLSTYKSYTLARGLTKSFETQRVYTERDVVGGVFFVGAYGGKSVNKIIESMSKAVKGLNSFLNISDLIMFEKYLTKTLNKMNGVLPPTPVATTINYEIPNFKFLEFSSIQKETYTFLSQTEHFLQGTKDKISTGTEAIDSIIELLELKIKHLDKAIDSIDSLITTIEAIKALNSNQNPESQGGLFSVVIPPQVGGLTKIYNLLETGAESGPFAENYLASFFGGMVGGGTGIGLLSHMIDSSSISLQDALSLPEEEIKEEFSKLSIKDNYKNET